MKEAVIVAGVRTAVGKAHRGTLCHTRPDDMAAVVLKELLLRAGNLDPAVVDDVILGCAYPEAEQGGNVARLAALLAGFPVSVAGVTVHRFCASGLEAIVTASQRITCGSAKVIAAGGTESMSMVPRGGHGFSPNPSLAANWPEPLISMGLTAEKVAAEFGVSREDQDKFSLRSHRLASAAIKEGRFKDEIVPLQVKTTTLGQDGRVQTRSVVFDTDEGARNDSNPASMAKLPAVFKTGGTVTAGNSSQMSDGSAAVLVADREAAESYGLEPLARLAGYAVCGVRPEIMGIGPAAAVPKVLEQTGMILDDIELIELNEAFAAQALAVMRKLGIDEERVNVNGGAIALGHPLGCTGAKLTVQLLNEMKRRGVRYGMVTMCVGGGQGAAAIFERFN